MEALRIDEICKATRGTLLGEMDNSEATVSSVETDSRSIREGGLFIPLVGENFDGHDFVEKALKSGASATLVMREPETYVKNKHYILVEDTQLALGDLAFYYRSKFNIPVVAITGSVGKTTTKDMVASVLGEKFRVLKTQGNFNNEIGLPLTIFRLDSSHEICVLEMGMNHFGEIDYLGRIAPPEVAIITNIGDAHIENLGSHENILRAKSEIFPYVKHHGIAVLNGDDAMLQKVKGTIPQEIIYYGTRENVPYLATEIENVDGGVACHVEGAGFSDKLFIPSLGRHMVYAALAAIVTGKHFGLSEEEIIKGVRSFVPTKMRMNVVELGDISILDDAYNANPQSMRAALEVLSQSDASYKVAILGDMFELGSLGPTLHHGVGDYASKLGIDCLIAIG